MHPRLRAAADLQLGIVTAADAHRAGYSAAEIRSLCSSGRWIRIRRGVYVPAETLADHEARGRRHQVDCLAVLLALGRPSAALSHGTAVRLRGLPVPTRTPAVIRLTDPHQWRRGRDWTMTAAPVDPRDVDVSGPFRLTSRARSLVDAAREWSLEDAVIALDAALLEQATTPTELARVVEAQRHWPGAPRAQRAVALADGRAESPLETRGRLRMLGAGLPAPELQVGIWSEGRELKVVDAWFEEPAVAVEFDGQVKYTEPWRDPGRVLWEEKRKEDEVRALGIRVLRLADADLGARWPRTEGRLRELLAGPAPSPRRWTARQRTEGTVRTRSRGT